MEEKTIQSPDSLADSGNQLANELLGLDAPDIATQAPVEAPRETPTEMPVEAQEQPLEGQTEVSDVNPLIDHMRSTFAQQGIEVEIPDEFKGNDVPVDKVYEFVTDTLNKQISSSDPLTSQWAEARGKGMSMDDFLSVKMQQRELLTLPEKEFLTRLYKVQNGKSEQNPNGYSDEDIEQHINKLSPVELKEAVTGYKEQLNKSFNSPVQVDSAKREESIKLANQESSKIADKLIGEMSRRKEIGGIPHTQSDIEEFTPVFKDLIEKNPETGRTRVQEMLFNDETLYEILYTHHKLNSGGLKKYLSQFKESYKQEVLDKTGLRPRSTGGQTYTVSVPTPDDYA